MKAMKGVEAIDIAVEIYRKPARARSLHRHDVPPGMLKLIKIAAGTEDEVDALVGGQKSEALPVKEAAVFYLQQLLMNAGNDDYRQLGLSRGATLQDVKDHKRMLLKWLHPDRNPSAWEQVLFGRVKASADRLEGAIRIGDDIPFPTERRRPGRKRRNAAWQAAQARVKQPVDWRPRLKKIAIAAIVFLLIVGTAQAVLSYSSLSGFPSASTAAMALE
jgi:hypothetical protein